MADFVPGSFDFDWRKPPKDQQPNLYPETNLFPFKDGIFPVPEWWVRYFPLTDSGDIDGRALQAYTYREMQHEINKHLSSAYLKATKHKLGLR